MTNQTNDVMMEKFALSPGTDFPRNFSGKDLKTVNVIVIACGVWFHLSFAHFHIISMVDHGVYIDHGIGLN